jgi:hypothetical protein
VFFNYNHFHGALRTADNREANLNRGVVGFESILLNDTLVPELWSLEVRVPFSSGLNSDQVVSPTADNIGGEFGNVSLAMKRLLFQGDEIAASAGLAVIFPTGQDTRLFTATGTLSTVIENEAYYLQPFVGVLWTPDSCFFAQFAAQASFDACGNTVDYLRVQTPFEGVIQDQALLFLDASFGYWLFHDPCCSSLITGVAPMVELHYNTTMQDADLVDAGDTGLVPLGEDQVTDFRGRFDVFNLTGALRLELAGRSYLTLLGVFPLRTGDDKLFDAEFGVQFSRTY